MSKSRFIFSQILASFTGSMLIILFFSLLYPCMKRTKDESIISSTFSSLSSTNIFRLFPTFFYLCLYRTNPTKFSTQRRTQVYLWTLLLSFKISLLSQFLISDFGNHIMHKYKFQNSTWALTHNMCYSFLKFLTCSAKWGYVDFVAMHLNNCTENFCSWAATVVISVSFFQKTLFTQMNFTTTSFICFFKLFIQCFDFLLF